MKSALLATNGERLQVTWGERKLSARLLRTSRRVLRIDVHPNGQVVVFAPEDGDMESIRERVKRKSGWIFRELDRIAGWPARTPARQYLSGETHLLLGKQYRLSIEQSEIPQVVIEGGRIKISVCDPAADRSRCATLMREFYAAIAREVFNQRLDAIVTPFERKGMTKPPLIIRMMSKRWGSFTPSGRIVLNVDLVRASPALIDYVICHELAHGFFPDHGKGWRDLLSTVMPDWESRKARLEAVLR